MVEEKTKTVFSCECLRCQWVWESNGDEKPKRCAKCKSPYWETPVKQKHKKRQQRHDLQQPTEQKIIESQESGRRLVSFDEA